MPNYNSEQYISQTIDSIINQTFKNWRLTIVDGNSNLETYNISRAGTGGSEYSDLKAEFSNLPHERGTLSMARSSDPNSANSQFFICFGPAPHLDRQYTVFGKVVEGMEYVDSIKRGEGSNGEVKDPDKIISLKAK